MNAIDRTDIITMRIRWEEIDATGDIGAPPRGDVAVVPTVYSSKKLMIKSIEVGFVEFISISFEFEIQTKLLSAFQPLQKDLSHRGLLTEVVVMI